MTDRVDPRDEIVRRAFDAFRADADALPPLTLRGGNAVDSYDFPEPYDPAQDEPTDAYLEGFAFWGLIYLDAQSWCHYQPRLIDYTFRHPDDPAMVTEALVRSLRPPDRYPPRLASLTAEQEGVIVAFLEELALGAAAEDGGSSGNARKALEEWWLPGARHRPSAAEVAARRAAPVTYHEVGVGPYRLELPTNFQGGEVHDIPAESRVVQLWHGELCGDVPTAVAVNRTPLGGRTLRQAIRKMAERLRESDGDGRPVDIPGAAEARHLHGLTRGDSPAEPERFGALLVVRRQELITLTVRSWPRHDVEREVERIIGSFRIAAEGSSGDEP